MSDDEVRAFLDEQMIVSCATVGPRGRPHLVPLWYVRDGGELMCWTYARSQKARNLERDPRATLEVETGVQYHELRGVMMECDAVLERDAERVARHGVALFERYGGGSLDGETRAMVERQAAKRVGLRFSATRVVSWDHRKLGGVY